MYLLGGLILYFRHNNLTAFLLAIHLLGGTIALFCGGAISMQVLPSTDWHQRAIATLLVVGNTGYLAGVFFALRFPEKKPVLRRMPYALPLILFNLPLLHGVQYFYEIVSFASMNIFSVILVALMLIALIQSFVRERDGFIKAQIGIMLLVIGWGLIGFYALFTWPPANGLLRLETTDIALLSLTSLFAMVATFENVTLYKQKQRTQEQSRMERKHLREELHDNMLNRLANISLLSNAALKSTDPGDKASERIEVIKKEATSYSQYARGLMRVTDDDCTWDEFCSQLRGIGYELTAPYELDFVMECTETPHATPLSPLIKVAIYIIFAEAIGNTAKHARASRIQVELSLETNHATLTYKDNGIGFDPTAEHPGHYGLKAMRRRAIEIGGTLDLDADTEGMLLKLRVPL
jgi:signal transduction histidine kinase